MIDLEMEIKQGNNGWILKFIGHDGLEKTIICKKWVEVKREIDDYFGWYNLEGKHSKINPY